jgi:hypothetical protein
MSEYQPAIVESGDGWFSAFTSTQPFPVTFQSPIATWHYITVEQWLFQVPLTILRPCTRSILNRPVSNIMAYVPMSPLTKISILFISHMNLDWALSVYVAFDVISFVVYLNRGTFLKIIFLMVTVFPLPDFICFGGQSWCTKSTLSWSGACWYPATVHH